MELWIRSQSKRELITPIALDIKEMSTGRCTIYGYSQNGYSDNIELGDYESNERALEILDEIQNILKPKLLIKNEGKMIYGRDGNIYNTNIVGNENTEIQELSTYVYQMPKE